MANLASVTASASALAAGVCAAVGLCWVAVSGTPIAVLQQSTATSLRPPLLVAPRQATVRTIGQGVGAKRQGVARHMSRPGTSHIAGAGAGRVEQESDTPVVLMTMAFAAGILLYSLHISHRKPFELPSITVFTAVGYGGEADPEPPVLELPTAAAVPWDPLTLSVARNADLAEVTHGRVAMLSTLGVLAGSQLPQVVMGEGLEAMYAPVFAGMWLLLVPFTVLCEWPALEALEHMAEASVAAARHVKERVFDPLGLKKATISAQAVDASRSLDPLHLTHPAGSAQLQHGRLALLGTLGLLSDPKLHKLLIRSTSLTEFEAMYLPVLAGFSGLLIPFLLLCEWPAVEAIEHEVPLMLRIPIDQDPMSKP